METKQPENIIFKKSHANSKIVLENLSLFRNEADRSLLDKSREDIVILQVMVLERHGALVEYVTAEDYKAAPLAAVFDITKMVAANEFSGSSDT